MTRSCRKLHMIDETPSEDGIRIGDTYDRITKTIL